MRHELGKDTCKTPACGVQHGFTDAHCIRLAGHSGRCWNRWQRDSQRPRYLIRTEWVSRDGEFFIHYGYTERFVGAPQEGTR